MYGYSHLSELSHMRNDIVTTVMKNIFGSLIFAFAIHRRSDWFPLGNTFLAKIHCQI